MLAWTGLAQAQSVTTDGSLNTVVTSPNGLDFTITNGTTKGSNLFHSFSQFSVPTGGSASFNNAINIQNIFARVTGSTSSNIDGLLQANGTANLFLLNPNGILFGPNASLNLGGSLIGTTANSIQFADGSEFSAINPTPLLTMSVPVGLQMGQNPAAIQVQGMGHRLAGVAGLAPYQPSAPYSGLQVQAQQTLALVGGNLDLTGAVLQAPAGRVDLGSVAQPGLIGLQRDSQGFVTTYAGVARFGSIHLAQRSIIEVGSSDPGNIQIHGGQVSIQDGSLLSNTNLGPQAGGTIDLMAAQSLTLNGATPVDNVLTGIRQDNFGAGRGGTTTIQTPDLLIQSGASLFDLNFGAGVGGSVILKTGRIQITGAAADAPDAISQVGTITFSDGKGGSLDVFTQNLSLSDGGFIGSSTFLNGLSGGDVVVNADTIDVQGRSPINVSSAIGAYSLGFAGQSGNLTVNTRTLLLRNGGLVETATISDGNAGNLLINANESIDVSGYGSSDFYESTISSSVSRPTPIYQELFGLPAIPTATGGNVMIRTPNLIVSDGGNVNVSNYGVGNAGNLTIQAGKISLKNDAIIGALAASGNGGLIDIQADQIVMINNSRIGGNAAGRDNTGNGGSIQINAPLIVGMNNSDILANAYKGNGGNIYITTQVLLGLKYRSQLTPDSDINASSDFGINGNVQVNTISVDPTSGLVKLPIDIVDPPQKIATGCVHSQVGHFVVTGRGGIPVSPNWALHYDQAWRDVRAIPDLKPQNLTSTMGVAISEKRSAIAPEQLLEATAWRLNAQGQPELLAGRAIAPNRTILTCAQ